MSLIDKFTIGFNMEKTKRRSNIANNISIKGISENQELKFLSQELVEILINFGFDLKQIMVAYKEYKFSNIDEACYYLMKDNDTKKYNHKFFKIENEENMKYTNIKNINSCFVCGGEPIEHIYHYDPDISLNILTNNTKNYLNNNQHNSNAGLLNKNEDNINNLLKNVNMKSKLKSSNNKANNDFNINSHIVNNKDNSIDKFTGVNLVSLNNPGVSGNLENNQSNKTKILQRENKENINNMLSTRKNILKKLEKDEESQLKSPTNSSKNFNKIKVDIPAETLDLFNDPDVCTICFAEKISANNKAEFPCGHKFCRKCVSNYLTNSIMNGKVL